MNQLRDDKDVEFFKKQFNYTAEEREAIKKVDHLYYFGFRKEVTDEFKTYITSLEGLQQQLDRVENPTTLLYYINVVDNKCDVSCKAVHVKLGEETLKRIMGDEYVTRDN